MRVAIFAVLGALACGSADTPRIATDGPKQAADTAPDLALLLVAGLRSSPGEPALQTGEGALRAELPPPTLWLDNAYAQSSAPFSSLGAILTGRYPGAIPMCNRLLSGEHQKTEAQQAWCARIPDTVHTLPSVLAVYGYTSLLVTADLPGAQSLAVGFGEHIQVDDWSAVEAQVAQWWARNTQGPRFVTVVLGDGDQTVLGQPSLKRFPEHRLQWLETVTPDVARVELDPTEVRVAYAAGAAQAGRVFSGVIETTRAGTERPAWAVVAGTSGMSLDERTGFGDAPVPLLTDNILLERTLRVPLLIYGGAVEQGRSDRIVQTIDILPTLTGLAGALAPAGAAGQDLLKTASGAGEAYAEFGDMIALRSGKYLLVFRCSLHNSTALDPTVTEQLKSPLSSVPQGHYALYDVQADPLQLNNLRRTEPQRVAAMRTRMVAIRTGAAAPPSGTMTPQRLWALRMAPSDGYW